MEDVRCRVCGEAIAITVDEGWATIERATVDDHRACLVQATNAASPQVRAAS